MCDSILASASAEVMFYNETMKQWEPPKGSDDHFIVQIVKNQNTNSFRIIAFGNLNNAIVLNCNIHHKLKYHTATPTFHQWRDEHRKVYGLNFTLAEDAKNFCFIMGEAISYLGTTHHSDYQQLHHDNVYQDPHQHMPHNQSAPTIRDYDDSNGLHPSYRKSSHSVQGSQQLTQQQRRSSQSSNSSSNAGLSGMIAQMSVAPRPSNIPPAPAPPPVGGAPPAPPPPTSGIAPVGNAPPPPPPPPSNLSLKPLSAPSFADQLKNKVGNLNKTGTPSAAVNGAVSTAPAPPPAAAPKGDFLQELAQSFKNRKANQAKADAVDNKSNTSNGSSDSGVFPPANKPKVNGSTTIGSPKSHRKAPSASSISSQEESVAKTVNEKLNGLSQIPVTAETLERFRAELMTEVRLEINKAKQDIIEALRAELARR